MSGQKSRRGKGKRNGNNNSLHSLKDSALDELAAAIEGKFIKEGSTKSQIKFLEQKKFMEAIEKAQQAAAAVSASSASGSRSSEAMRTKSHTEMMRKEWLSDVKGLGMNSIPHQEYVNKEVLLPKEYCEWNEIAPHKYVRYEQFKGTDEEMEFVVNFFAKMLSEPYSSFTYQYFVFGWPDLCVTAYGIESEALPDARAKGERVGAIVSRVTRKGPLEPLRGYVAMFAVGENFRGNRLGRRLVSLTVELMKAKDCDEVYLETPATNARALDLYHNVGFTKTKFLPRYYLDHSDAFRMVLWLKNALPPQEEGLEDEGRRGEENSSIPPVF